MAHKTRLSKTPLRVEDLPRECRIVRYEDWDGVNPYALSRLSYDHLHPVNAGDKVLPTDLVELPLCGGSDYSGSLVEKSNHRVMLERYGDLPGVWDVYGGHGTFAVVVALRQKDKDLWEDVRSMVDDYPLLDEEELSELEREDQDSQWESWVRSDFAREVSKQYRVDILACEDSDVRTLFETTADEANIYWEDEGSGSGMYISVEKVAESIEDRALLLALPGAVDEER